MPGSSSNPLLAHSLSLISLHFLTRIITFSLNQLLLRTTTPRAFGIATVQFDVLLGGVVFLAREGVREVCLRGGGGGGSSTNTEEKAGKRAGETGGHPQSLANLTYLPIVLGIPLTILSYGTYMLRLASPEATSQPHFTEAVALYAVAGLLELASEPMYCLAITTLKTSARVRAEGLGVTVKSIVTFVVLYLSANYPQYLRLAVGLFGGKPAEVASDGEFALLAFALGQLAYGATILAAFVSAFWSQRETVKFREISAAGKTRYWFNKGTLTLALTINAQSILKHVLTEGDKLVLSYFSPLDGQGGYAIAANYGSLVARLLFQPIEETLRLFFARTLSTQGLSSLVRAHTSLVHLINTQLSLSLILVTFAPLYLPYVLPILLPPAFLRTTNAAELLGVWIWYLPVLSVNGALEAFVAVTSGKWDLAWQSFFMLIFSVVYLASSYVLYVHLGVGDAAFIYANIISLLARIGYALSFIRAYFRARFDALNDESKSTSKPYPFALNPTKLLPHPFLIAFCGLSRVVLTTPFVRPPPPPKAYSTRLGPIKQLFEAQVTVYIAVGLLCAVTSLGVWWKTSGRKIRQSQSVAEKKED